MSGLMPAGDILEPGTGRVLFARRELACRSSDGLRLHPGFSDALARLRMVLGQPMIVTSCCRSAAHNGRVGGHPRSLHIYDRPMHAAEGCCAIDVARRDPSYNTALIELALSADWSVGVARTFIHLDRRVDLGLPQNVFGYGGQR